MKEGWDFYIDFVMYMYKNYTCTFLTVTSRK